jgi:hypothetical protein
VIEVEGFGAIVLLLVIFVAVLRIRDGRTALEAIRSSDFWKWK